MSGKYKGKRVAVTIPQATYDLLAKLSEEETRTVATMALVLIEESLKNRGVKP